MNKHLIQLKGDPLDIKDLSWWLRTSNWKIIKETNDYYLSSEILDKITDPKEIMSKGKQLLDILNGSANIIYGNHKRVTEGSLVSIDKNGKRIVKSFTSGSIEIRSRMRGTLVSKDNNNLRHVPTKIDCWIDKAYELESVRNVLYFFNDITWWNLFKIFEIIRDDIGGEKRLNNYIEIKKIKQFTQTAQSRESLGDDARHASKRFKPHPESLTLNEASLIIKKLFENWIKDK